MAPVKHIGQEKGKYSRYFRYYFKSQLRLYLWVPQKKPQSALCS